MPLPSAAILRPDLAETFEEFDVEAQQRAFIGLSVFPTLEVAEKAAHFGRIPLEALLLDPDTSRGPKGNYNRADYKFEQDTYACLEQGWEEVVDDDLLKQYRYIFDAEQVAASRAMGIILRGQEQRISDAVFNTTTWTGVSLTTAVSVAWDVPATATPIADVDAAKQAVRDSSGLAANTMIIDWEVMKNLRNVDEIVERIKYSGRDDPKGKAMTPTMLADVFDLDQVLVAGISAVGNAANQGQAATPTALWSNGFAMIARVATSNDMREPCIGRSFNWSEDSDMNVIIEEYREESARGSVIRARHTVTEKVLYPQAGHLLTGIST